MSSFIYSKYFIILDKKLNYYLVFSLYLYLKTQIYSVTTLNLIAYLKRSLLIIYIRFK